MCESVCARARARAYVYVCNNTCRFACMHAFIVYKDVFRNRYELIFGICVLQRVCETVCVCVSVRACVCACV